MMPISWTAGSWLNEPPEHRVEDGFLHITTGDQSDFWNETAYGFTHYSGHALLADFPPDTAMEVEFSAEWTSEFDQAGLMIYADANHWIKAGLELADGVLGLGAVVTATKSDWSVGHVPEWMSKRIRIRVSRTSDAVTVRARTPEHPWRLVRLAPIDPQLRWRAGPFAASPTRSGLHVSFSDWGSAAPDEAVHE